VAKNLQYPSEYGFSGKICLAGQGEVNMTFSKFKSVFQSYNFLFVGLLVVGVGLILNLGLIFLNPHAPSGNSGIRWMLSGGLSLGLAVALGLGAFVYAVRIRPIEQITGRKQSLETDSAAFKNGLSQLAQGDLTRRFSVISTPISIKARGDLASMTGTLNELIAGFSQLSEEFNTVTEIPCLRLCYVGANRFTEGRRCGEIMGRLLEGKGKVAVNLSSFLNAGHSLRYRGFASYLNQHYPGIQIIDVVELKENDGLTYEHVANLIEKQPGFNGYYLTQGATPSSAARAVMDAGKAGAIKIIAHDCTDKTMPFVKKGLIHATLGQSPVLQGHNPIIHLYNHLVSDWMPATPLLYTPTDVVTPENYRHYWEEGLGEIQTQEGYDRMAKVAKKYSGRPLRIVSVGRENSPFWIPVKRGVLQAANKLKPLGIKVEWIVPENSQNGADIRASVYGPVIDSLVAQKVDGIAIVAADRNLIPYINRAVKSGVPVVTYNVDPDSLRGMFHMIAGQSQKLKHFSQRLIQDMQTADRSTEAVEREMLNLDKRTIDQNSQIHDMRASLGAVANYMDQIHRDSDAIRSTTASVWDSLGIGTDALETTFESIQNIRQAIEKTRNTAEALNHESEKIQSVVNMIDGVVSRVNVLSLNAAIESTKARMFRKAFGEVSAEIRKLAKTTSESTQEVAKLLGDLQIGIIRTNKLLKSNLGRIKESEDKTEQTKTMLAQIRSAIQKEDNRVRRISQLIGTIREASHQVGDAMDNVGYVSIKNTEAVKRVTLHNNELVAGLKEVSTLAQTLETMAQSEEDLLVKFSIEEA